MKVYKIKLFLRFFILLILISMINLPPLFADENNFEKPSLYILFAENHETLNKGTEYRIRWVWKNYSGNIKINLYLGGILFTSITDNEPVTNGESGIRFVPSNDWPDSDFYRIGIFTLDNRTNDFTNAYISIKNCPTYYRDCDNDGFGNPNRPLLTCTQFPTFVLDNSDCYDYDETVYSDAPELCDGIDNNCNGEIDEGLPQNTYYYDSDQDGFGDPNNTKEACALPPGSNYVSNNSDCNDDNALTNPNAPERCDGLDNDCDGDPNQNEVDNDDDGFMLCEGDCNDGDNTIYPDAMESCDDIDSDCDGDLTEGCTDPNSDVYNFIIGWNQMTPTRIPCTPFMASNLANSINSQGGAITRIQRWNGSGWETYQVGAPFGNYEIEAGRGYFLLSSKISQWTITGTKPTHVSYFFTYGWNLYGFPIGVHYSARTLCEEINNNGGSINRVQKWDNGAWITYQVGAPFGNFELNPTDGLFFLSDGLSTFEIFDN